MIGYTKLLPGRWGWMLTLACDPYQSQSVALYGEWAPSEMAVLASLIKPGDVILDCGANIGSRAIPFGILAGPGGRVYAIEPQRLPYLCLAANIALNSLGMTVYPFHAAISDQPGEIEVPMIDPMVPNNVSGLRLKHDKDRNLAKTIGAEVVPCITIDGMNLDRCSLIKIDVEGMEADVIRGGRETIAKHKPIIWAESLPHEAYLHTRDDLRTDLQALGYKGWHIATPVFTQNNVRSCPANPYEDQADHNVFCIPREQEPPPWIEQAKAPVFIE